MPNRIIKESIRTSKKINNLNDFQFRLWLYLITYVDDYGRGSADPELVKSFVFPRRKRISESDIEKALAELAGMGCILLYEVDGESYFYFPNWGEHQRIQTKKSKFPEPPETGLQTNQDDNTEIRGESRCDTETHILNPNPNPNTNPNPREGTHARERFVPPTLEEVTAYCLERGNAVDPQRFIDFYSSKNWMVGKNKMADWKAAVRGWERSEHSKPVANLSMPTRAFNTMQSRTDFDFDAIEQRARQQLQGGNG